MSLVSFSSSSSRKSPMRFTAAGHNAFAPFLILVLALVTCVDAEGLRGHEWAPAASLEDVDSASQPSLLAEIERSLGSDHRRITEHRTAGIEEALNVTFRAMPKNKYGKLGHAAVRYAVHRYFVQRHGWFVKGLEPKGGAWNSTSPSQVLSEEVPLYVQGLFEKRLGGQGFNVHEMAVYAATLENIIHNESLNRLNDAYKVHHIPYDEAIEIAEVDNVLDTFMVKYILGDDSLTTAGQAIQMRKTILERYPAWPKTQNWVRSVRRSVFPGHRSSLTFADVTLLVEELGDRYGRWQNQECLDLKKDLLRSEDRGSGCVRLSDFYGSGSWQFQESPAYLRELGALDTTDPGAPRVIVPNYIGGPSNCVATSKYYQVCCLNECEDLVGHLERELGMPDATPAAVAAIVASLPSSSVHADRTLPVSLLERLDQIARVHQGNVPLHSRLFAQWMHHAYPRECPFPHISGTTKPQLPDDFIASGRDPTATKEEIVHFTSKSLTAQELEHAFEGSCSSWHDAEELPFAPWPAASMSALEEDEGLWMSSRFVCLLSALSAMSVALVRLLGSTLFASGDSKRRERGVMQV